MCLGVRRVRQRVKKTHANEAQTHVPERLYGLPSLLQLFMNGMDTIMQLGTTQGIHVWASSTTKLQCFQSRNDGSASQPGGVDPIFEKQKATRCNSGDKILPYMLRLIFEKFLWTAIMCIFFIFSKLNENVPIPDQFHSIQLRNLPK